MRPSGELCRDRQSGTIGQHDVEQHHVGAQGRGLVHRRCPIDGLADHLEAGLGQHTTRQPAKARVVVDDQHLQRHVPIVPATCSGTSLNQKTLRDSPDDPEPGRPYRRGTMRSRRLTVILTSTLAATLAVPAPSSAATRSTGRQTLFFHAVATNSRTAGPDADHVGHEQIASGVLHNAAGHRAGHYAFTCRWIQILRHGDARERCTGSSQTADGRLDFAGMTRHRTNTDTFAITRGTGGYQGARGTLVSRAITDAETVVIVTVTPRHGALLRVGMVLRPPANTRFIARANHLCTSASRRLAALPPFPFANFDPLHPDPTLLPQVGAFFTGPGDPRPILRILNARLRGLRRPPAERRAWTAVLDARAAALAVINRQVQAALAADIPGFVKSVNDNTAAFRQIAITATVFGATTCVV
jgi:hypothetical protein